MNKRVGLTLIIFSVILVGWVAYVTLGLGYWLLPPEQKFAQSWKTDIALLEKSQKLPKQWNDIKEVSLRAAAGPAQDWIAGHPNPISSQILGHYKLDIFVIHWLEGYRYGVVIQYNLVDLKNQNTVWELGRTLKLGFVY